MIGLSLYQIGKNFCRYIESSIDPSAKTISYLSMHLITFLFTIYATTAELLTACLPLTVI